MSMSEEVHPSRARSDWPIFSIRHSYNPDGIAPQKAFEPNEVVLYDATQFQEGRWLSAKFGSYVPITDTR